MGNVSIVDQIDELKQELTATFNASAVSFSCV